MSASVETLRNRPKDPQNQHLGTWRVTCFVYSGVLLSILYDFRTMKGCSHTGLSSITPGLNTCLSNGVNIARWEGWRFRNISERGPKHVLVDSNRY